MVAKSWSVVGAAGAGENTGLENRGIGSAYPGGRRLAIRRRVMKRLGSILLLSLLFGYAVLGARPAWRVMSASRWGRDYATYHYAVIEAVNAGGQGRGDPYDRLALSRRARQAGTSRGVHPYFYPPPALLPMLWIAPPGLPALSLSLSLKIWFVVQQLSAVAVGLVLWRWLSSPPLLLGLVFCLFSPIPDNLKMGQANLPVLLLLLLGLWRGQGALVGAAAMVKMSPAVHLLGLAASGRWRAVAASVGVAILLSILALPLVPLETQLRFYLEVLPGFSSGQYNGLGVPITLPSNHSIPDLLNQVWPGPDDHTLDPRARFGSQGLVVLFFAVLALAGRGQRDALGQASLHGSLSVLMVLAPVYAYEHHLVFLLLPIVAAFTAWWQGRLPRAWIGLLLPAYVALAWPLSNLRELQDAAPLALRWWIQESKFFGAVMFGIACVEVLRRSPRLGNGGVELR